MSLTYRESERRRKAEWRKNNPEKARRQNRNGQARKKQPFIAVDGEGYDDDNGRHLYNMLRAGDRLLLPRKRSISHYVGMPRLSVFTQPYRHLCRLLLRLRRHKDSGEYLVVQATEAC
jgi:hypothetical protein